MTSTSINAPALVLGAVAYDQKVVPIWDGFLQYFRAHGLPFDYVLFSNYERQVEAQVRGHIHVAWHSPLAWLQTARIAGKSGLRSPRARSRSTSSRNPAATIASKRRSMRTASSALLSGTSAMARTPGRRRSSFARCSSLIGRLVKA